MTKNSLLVWLELDFFLQQFHFPANYSVVRMRNEDVFKENVKHIIPPSLCYVICPGQLPISLQGL